MKLCVIKHIPFEENYLKKKSYYVFSQVLQSKLDVWSFISSLSCFISIQKNISGRAGGKKELFSNKLFKYFNNCGVMYFIFPELLFICSLI